MQGFAAKSITCGGLQLTCASRVDEVKSPWINTRSYTPLTKRLRHIQQYKEEKPERSGESKEVVSHFY